MYITLLERFGDVSSYTEYVYITDAPLDLKKVAKEFKSYFNLSIIDNSSQTMDLFKDYIEKTYGFKPYDFKYYTIAED
jgi:hypothetical protein